VGRRRISEDDVAFRTEIAQQFRAAMKAHNLRTQTEAARELDITRQAFSQYLRKKTTPQAEILARACARWNLTLKYRTATFKRGAFGVNEVKTELDVLQLDLFREPQVFENADLVVSVERAQRSALQITIKMKKAALRRPLPKARAATNRR
jgi:transcriptional regulator with XRE-family HTH domain